MVASLQSPAARLASELWQDLPGKGWAKVGACYGLVKEVYRRAGVDLPDLERVTAHGWERLLEPEAGALVLMTWDGRPHVGVALGGDELLHATERTGVIVSRLSAARHAKRVEGFYRWTGDLPIVHEPEPAPTDLTIIELDVAGNRQIRRIPWQDGLKRVDFEGPEARVYAGEVRPGGFLCLQRGARDVGTLLIGLALSLLGTLIQSLLTPSLPKPSDVDEPSTPTFDLSSFLANRSGVGAAQPVVYGEHRVGGHIISAFQKADEQDRSVLYLLLMVSRGPIESIAGLTSDRDDLSGPDIPSDIEIDGNPASSYECKVSTRLGTSEQEAIPGFRETLNVFAYDVTLLVGSPFTHSPTSRIRAFEVNINFPLGLYNVNIQNGNLGPRTVTFAIRHRVQNTTTWTTSTFVVTNARRGVFLRTFRKEGLTRDFYEIQVERISPAWPETQTDHESKSVFSELHEITTDQLSYPGKALLGVKAVGSDQLSGGIPQITCKIKGRKVYVWDGVSTTVPAFGAGEVYTDNPAWCMMDMLINPTYGMARNGKLTLDNIDLTSFLNWANLCDTMVDDGRGGTVKRAVFDFVIDTVRSGWELLTAIAASHWARLTMAGRKISVVRETTGVPVYQFSMGNVRDVKLGYLGRKQRTNAVEVQYFNEETNYEADFASKQDDAAIFTSGEAVVKESIQAVGVTRAAQAYRLAQFRMLYAKNAKRLLEFTSGVESIHLLPGDLIHFSHDAPQYGTSGRVLSAGASSIKIDAPLTIPSGTNAILVRTKGTGADVFQERTLTNGTYARNDSITVGLAWDAGDVPVAGDVYAAGATTTYTRKFRILDIETTPTLDRRFRCVEYAAAIYSDDPGTVETFTDIMPDPRKVPAVVSNVSIRQIETQASDGTRLDGILAEWDTDERWQAADVWYRPMEDDAQTEMQWTFAGRSREGRLTIPALPGGSTYVVSVLPVAPRGTHRRPENGTIAAVHLRGWREPPPAPLSVTAHVIDGMLHVAVEEAEAAECIVGYQIRYGGSWSGSVLIAHSAPAQFSCPAPFTGTQTIRVRSITKTCVVSTAEKTYSVTFQLPTSSYTLTDSQDENPGWTGTKTNTAVSGTALVLSGTNLSGTYARSVTETGVRRGAVTVNGKLQDVQRTWEDCSFRWGDEACNKQWQSFYLDGFECSEGLTWEQAGFRWDSLPAQCRQWQGPMDIVEALTPTLVVTDGAGGTDSQTHTFERTVTNPSVSVTMRRPHANYVPELTTMNQSLWEQGEGTPVVADYNTSVNLGVGSTLQGFNGSGSSDIGFGVPSGKSFYPLACSAVALMGATAGSNYDVDVIIVDGAGTVTVIASSENNSNGAYVYIAPTPGTVEDPLATAIAGPTRLRVGLRNRAGSTGAWATAHHAVTVSGVIR